MFYVVFHLNIFYCKYLQYLLEFLPTKNVVYSHCLKNNLKHCYSHIPIFSIVNYHGPGLTVQGQSSSQLGIILEQYNSFRAWVTSCICKVIMMGLNLHWRKQGQSSSQLGIILEQHNAFRAWVTSCICKMIMMVLNLHCKKQGQSSSQLRIVLKPHNAFRAWAISWVCKVLQWGL